MFAITTETLPIKVWLPDASHVDDATWDQARNLANHPLARRHVCLMPDCHVGYGMPIGGVLATKGGVVPNAVGVDIGCGMIAARTDLHAGALSRETLQSLRQRIHALVPVGMAHHKQKQPMPERLAQHNLGPLPVVDDQYDAASFQIGTLGGGNHFIEIQKDAESGAVWIMLHSGSRNVGLRVCNHFHAAAKRYMEQFHAAVPHIDLAFLPESVPEYRDYMAAMSWCLMFAEESRHRMFARVVDAFAEEGLIAGVEEMFDTHHNFAAMEHHFGENLLVHRKGAVKADGLVTIPGSMGTSSYIGRGLGPRDSFNTCSHGAGRTLGRKQANRTIAHERALESMQHVVYGVRQGEYDEMPDCYKDIDMVMEQQRDLVEPVHRLLPLAVVKG